MASSLSDCAGFTFKPEFNKKLALVLLMLRLLNAPVVYDSDISGAAGA
jgi:hypothetical protein